MSISAFEHVTRIRDEKYWLDEHGGLKGINPLAADLKDSIDHLAQGLYTRNAHFLFKLIQNAEDNSYSNKAEPSLTFNLLQNDPTNTSGADGALIVENNEVGFSKENFEAICAIGKSTKKSYHGFIGEKGIGFKSIFRVTSKPFLFSNGYKISLPESHEKTGLGYIVPEWAEVIPECINKSLTSIVLPLDKPGFGYDAVKKMLSSIEPETILFLSKLKEIKIVTDCGKGFIIIKDDESEPNIQLLSNKNGYDEIFEFLLFKKCFDKPEGINHEKRNNVNQREVSIAFPIGEKTNSAGKLFAYLPVRFDIGFPFIINADFILPSSREDIQDTPWNRDWLMPSVGELVSTSLPLLKEKKQISVPFLESLAKSVLALHEDDMYFPIAKSVKKALTTLELLPADDGSFVSADNAKLARGADLRKLLSQVQLCQLFQSNEAIKWLAGEITQDRTSNLRAYLVNELDVEEITAEGFSRKISGPFLHKQTDEWMVKLYGYVGALKALWNPAGPLRSKSIIRLHDGTHVKPFRNDGSPAVYLTDIANTETSLPVVKYEISRDEDAFKFLRELGIPELDHVAEVIEKILPKYSNGLPTITNDEHRHDINAIKKAYATDSHEKKNRLRQRLIETPFIRAKMQFDGDTIYKKPSDLYFESGDLELFFFENKTVGFVVSEYSQTEMELFADLGVGNSVRVIRKNSNKQGFVAIKNWHGCHERGLSGFDPDIHIEGLENALDSPTSEKSEFIWNNIAIPNSDCIRGIIESSSRQTYENSTKSDSVSGFGHLLIETAWLPDINGDYKKPCNLRLDDLPNSFVRNERLAYQLGMKLDIIGKLAEEAGINPEILEYARNNPREIERLIAEDAARKERPTFPTRPVANPERRHERLGEQRSDALDKEYEKRERSVQVPTEITDEVIKTWLRNQYTNDDDQMVCQICKMEHFRKRNGEHHFEKKEVLTSKFLPKKLVAQYLALCPLCAAKYDEFVKTVDDVMDELKGAIILAEDCEIPISLGDEKTSIRFVETHYHDLKAIIEGVE